MKLRRMAGLARLPANRIRLLSVLAIVSIFFADLFGSFFFAAETVAFLAPELEELPINLGEPVRLAVLVLESESEAIRDFFEWFYRGKEIGLVDGGELRVRPLAFLRGDFDAENFVRAKRAQGFVLLFLKFRQFTKSTEQSWLDPFQPLAPVSTRDIEVAGDAHGVKARTPAFGTIIFMGFPPVTGELHQIVFLKLGMVGQIAVGNGIEAHPLAVFGDARATDEFVVFGADGRVSLDRDQQAKAGCCRCRHGQ